MDGSVTSFRPVNPRLRSLAHRSALRAKIRHRRQRVTLLLTSVSASCRLSPPYGWRGLTAGALGESPSDSFRVAGLCPVQRAQTRTPPPAAASAHHPGGNLAKIPASRPARRTTRLAREVPIRRAPPLMSGVDPPPDRASRIKKAVAPAAKTHPIDCIAVDREPSAPPATPSGRRPIRFDRVVPRAEPGSPVRFGRATENVFA